MKISLKTILLVGGFLIGVASWGQSVETFSERPGEKTIKGHLTRAMLETDTSFKWYAENYKSYKARPDAIQNLRKQADSIEVVAFMGTWCEDSHFVIPQLIALLDSAHFPKEKFSLIGVDRNKTTVGRLTQALNVKIGRAHV